MMLTDHQVDALGEVFNIAFSRTAAALSELTEQRVLLDAPQVAVVPIEDAAGAMSALVHGDVATVHQTFRGPVAGDALLLLNHERALALTGLLMPNDAPPIRLDASTREVLTEVGNILLNACLGTLSNLLQLHTTFSVPQVHLEAIDLLIDTLSVAGESAQYALIVQTTFRQQGSTIAGYVLLLLSVSALDRLLQAVDGLAETGLPDALA